MIGKLITAIFLILVMVSGWYFLTNITLKKQYNLVLINQPSMIVSIEPTRGELLALNIPDMTLLETIHGHGPYRIEAIDALGKLTNEGGSLYKGSIQESFALPVDGYLKTYKMCEGRIYQLRECLVANLWENLRKNKDTDIGKLSLFRLWWTIRNLSDLKIKVIDLYDSGVLTETTLADGALAYQLDPVEVDRFVKNLFEEDPIRKESLSVAVLNGTDSQGLAGTAARLIDNVGAHLVRVGDTESQFEKCLIKASLPLRGSATVRRLVESFGCDWQQMLLSEERADVVLILGNDYKTRLQE